MTAEGVSPRRKANDLTQLLDAVLGKDRFPVNVEALALEVSKNQRDPITRVVGAELYKFDGMLRSNRKKPGWTILYNNQTGYPGRERFTLAHELGHYVLHRQPLTSADYDRTDLGEGRDFHCVPLRTNKWKQGEAKREEEADTFASYLLMPIHDYRTQVGKQAMTRPLLEHISNRYGVSLLAAVRKWIEFTPGRAAMVVARDGFALWGRASEAALKTGIFVSSGMPIPEEAVAGRGRSSESANSREPVPISAGIWKFSGSSEQVLELTIFAEKLDTSISILTFEDARPGYIPVDQEEWDTFDQFQR